MYQDRSGNMWWGAGQGLYRFDGNRFYQVKQNGPWQAKKEPTKTNFARMNIPAQIEAYIAGQPEPKCSDLQALHRLVLGVAPDCQLWFTDGKNSEGKTVANPNIGYGFYTIHYADGSTRDFYQVGLSANTSGISVYIMAIKDKTYLAETYGKDLGKASVTGYCIKFKTLKAITLNVLEAAIRDGFAAR